MKIEDIVGGKFKSGNKTFEMVEAKYGGEIVWPVNVAYTYEIVVNTVIVTYSAGNILYASGSNSVSVTADVKVYANGVYRRTISGATLTPTLQSGSEFYISDKSVKGADRQFTPYPRVDEYVTFSYENSFITRQISQEANVQTLVSATPYGSKKYGQTSTTYGLYQVNFSADKYTSISSAAPASGATSGSALATLSCYAEHYEFYSTPWTQDATLVYSYTSRPGQTFSEVDTDYYSGTEQSQSVISDTIEAQNSIYLYAGGEGFSRNGMDVSIASEGVLDRPSGRSATYRARVLKDNGTYITQDVTLYQAKNEIVQDVPTTTRHWGSPTTTVSDDNYVVSLDANQYKSSSNPAPASGGTAALIISASHRHIETTSTPWQDVTYHTYTWSSGATNSTTPTVTDSGAQTSTETSTVQDTVTPSFSGSHTGFSFIDNNTKVSIASEGTSVYSSGRTATIVASNNSASASLVLYQEHNVAGNWVYVYDLSVAIDWSGNIPQAGGTFPVNYTSRRNGSRTYTSGATETTTNESVTSSVSGDNTCTPDVNSVSGIGTFSITVPSNTTQGHQVSVTISTTGASANDTKDQDYVTIIFNIANNGVRYNTPSNTSLQIFWTVANAYASKDFSIEAVLGDDHPEKNIILRGGTTGGTTTFNLASDFPHTIFTPGVQSTDTYVITIYDNSVTPHGNIMFSQSFTLTYQ